MNPTTTNETIIEEITIKGSAERIFKAIANPEERLKWWGSKGMYESTEMDSDLRVGGKWMMKAVTANIPGLSGPDYLNLAGTPAGRVTIQNPSSGSISAKRMALPQCE